MSKSSRNGPAVVCMKIFLLLFNFLFWVSGIALLVAGIWMKMTMTSFLSFTPNLSNSLPFSFIGIGAVITVIGFLACFCTVKGQSTLLYLLSIFLLVVFFMEIGVAVAGYVFRRDINSGLKNGLESAINHYGDDSNQDKNLDYIQKTVKCCGVDSYSDWFNTTWAAHNYTVPESCCKVKGCDTKPPVDENLIYTQGCFEQIINDVHSKVGIIAGVCVALACLQFLGSAVSFCLAKNVNGVRYEPMP